VLRVKIVYPEQNQQHIATASDNF